MNNFIRSVRQKWTYSIVGLWISFKEEKSLWAYFAIIPGLIGIGVWVDLSTTQWAMVSMIIFTVISIEVLNTALEATVDSISFQYNIKVKKIKDIASGATLVISTGAFVSVLLIYIPALMAL